MFMRLWLFLIGWALGIATVVVPLSYRDYCKRCAAQQQAAPTTEARP